MIKEAPESVTGYSLLADYYAKKNDFDNAEKYAMETLKRTKTGNKYVFDILANIAASRGHFDQALALYQKSIALDPSSAGGYLGIGSIYFATGQYQKALEVYEFAIEKSQNTKRLPIDRVLPYAATLAKLKQYEKSLQVLQDFAKGYEDDKFVRFIKAVNLYKMGQRQEAQAYFDWDTAKSYDEKILILENY